MTCSEAQRLAKITPESALVHNEELWIRDTGGNVERFRLVDIVEAAIEHARQRVAAEDDSEGQDE